MELESVIKDVVKKLESENVDSFEVVGLVRDSLVVEAKRQMVDSFRRSANRGIAIRVVGGGRVGCSATTDMGSRSISKAVTQAVDLMRIAGKSEESVIAKPQDPEGDFVEKLGRSINEIPDDDKIRIALKLESVAIAFDNRIARVRSPRYEEEIFSSHIENSNGISVSARRGLVSCDLRIIAQDNGLSESAYEFDYSPRFEDLDVEGTARRAAKRALAKLGATKLEKGRLPVIFDNRAGASMLGVFAPSFFADNVQRGKSFISQNMGEKLYSPLVTVVDDGLLSGGYASFPFDGEGIPMQRTLMVRDGRIDAWLYDCPRAMRDGVLSTGNCRRSGLRATPGIGVTNCFLKAGKNSVKELYSEVDRGVLVTDLMGAHTANTISGDFSLGAEGFLIENSEITQPIRGITIAGNVHELFKHIVSVGDDLRLFGSFGSPSFLVEGLMLGG